MTVDLRSYRVNGDLGFVGGDVKMAIIDKPHGQIVFLAGAAYLVAFSGGKPGWLVSPYQSPSTSSQPPLRYHR